MRLTINGKPETVENASTVAELLQHFDVPAVRVAVEVNRELVTRSQYDATALHDGDTVEIVTFVGGG
jgi:thiamine biosynthesis protein ThiS